MAKKELNSQTMAVIGCKELQKIFMQFCVGRTEDGPKILREQSMKYYVQIYKENPAAWPSGYDERRVDWSEVHKAFEKKLKKEKKNESVPKSVKV